MLVPPGWLGFSISNFCKGTQPQDFVTSLAHREIAWVQQYAVLKPPDDPLVTSASQNSPSSHIALLEKYLKVAPYLLPDDPPLVAPHIRHTDLHAGNIFVQDGKITSIIDWQEIWAMPLILRARHPQLVDYNGAIVLKHPANFKELDPAKKEEMRDQISRSIVLYLYEKQIAKEIPLLHKVLRYEYGRTRCEPILFAGDTWEDDILPLRESLIRLERFVYNLPTTVNDISDSTKMY